MTNIDRDNLDILLDKFFAGGTTVSEEKALEAFFCGGEHVPPEYECYRDMFKWYASGMDEARLPSKAAPSPGPKSWRRKAVIWWSSSAAAVAIGAALAISWAYVPAPQPSLYAETFVERGGRTIEGETEIRADIEAAVISGYCLEQEIDAQMKLVGIE